MDRPIYPSTEQIWRTLSDRLRQFVQARVTAAADVDDILQDVFLRIHAKLDSLRTIDRLESWVFQIARNAVTDHFRKGHNPTVSPDIDLVAESNSGRPTDNLNAVIASWLPAFIDQLPEDQRRAVTSYELEGLTQQEIAEQETISLSGAKSRVQRGRKQLRALLRDCCRFQFDRFGNVLSCEPLQCDCDSDSCD